MVNVYEIWNTIIKGLNSIDPKYLFIKTNSIHKLPLYPYATVNILNPYARDKDDIRGTVTHEPTLEGARLKRLEEPQMTFSLTFYSDKQEQLFKFMKDTSDWLQLQGKQYLSENDIILLKCSGYVDKTTILETDYVYKWGFDIRIRVMDIVTMDIDTIEKITIENNNIIETIEIEGGNING